MAMYYHLWVKPPNEDWYDATGRHSASYRIEKGVLEPNSYNGDDCVPPGLNGFSRKDGWAKEWRLMPDKLWRDRERRRMFTSVNGIRYQSIPDKWANHLMPIPDHYVHISKDNPLLIAYTQSEDKGERDIQTPMKPGKYLKKYYPELSNDDIRMYASTVLEQDAYEITMDPEVAAEVYINGPHSCMRRGRTHWDWYTDEAVDVAHPCAVYFAGDLGLAYMGEPSGAKARCLVWPGAKVYGRIYGDHEKLRQALEKDGFKPCFDSQDQEEDCFDGAQLKMIRWGKYILMPYLDGVNNLSFNKKTGQLFIGSQYGDDWHHMGSIEGESGYIQFKDPTKTYCCISNNEILPSQERVETAHGTALLHEAVTHGYEPTVEGEWTNSPRITEIDGVRELHMHWYNVRHLQYCAGDNTYRLKSDCIRIETEDGSNTHDRRGHAHKYINYNGTYYRNIKVLFQQYPNLNPGRFHPEFHPEHDKDVIKWIERLADRHYGVRPMGLSAWAERNASSYGYIVERAISKVKEERELDEIEKELRPKGWGMVTPTYHTDSLHVIAVGEYVP